ncbi:hypothetical protein RBG61_02100 [Paludicola sp. MB14-C6]|uniref:hypothetical protein n=1 Tax=Paludihabitans sp. MB14-C6 TaxID=3070656 RepID=UPI0027DB9D7A|nr:hypothetical protein [Paludicola sp. MB14-C6]WMJ23484.1 hypothetical protein RBG61_02100 [Paludicola sp. MB14-C6]
MISIKNLINFDDSKCAIKMPDVDEIRMNEFANGGPIVGVIKSKTATPESIKKTHEMIGSILGGEIIS